MILLSMVLMSQIQDQMCLWITDTPSGKKDKKILWGPTFDKTTGIESVSVEIKILI